MHKDSRPAGGIFIDLPSRPTGANSGSTRFSTFPKRDSSPRRMNIFDVENYLSVIGHFPPSLGLFRTPPPYIGCGFGWKFTAVIHTLLKTHVEKLHTRRFALYFLANIGFSTAVFNSLWISPAGFAPFFPREPSAAVRKQMVWKRRAEGAEFY